MAGAGYKSFSSGDVLTASDVNTFLMQQTVMVFADATARNSAISSPTEGMLTFLKSDDTVYYADAGGSWVAYIGAGDITGVTITTNATDGLSGGAVATSGAFPSTLKFAPNGLSAGAVTVASDSLVIIDADDSNNPKKESIADLATAMAGTNLTASSGQLNATASGATVGLILALG